MNYLEKAADTVLYNPGPWDELLFQTTINWQNMEISTDSWKSLTLPFKAMVKLYELRNAEIDTYMYIWCGVWKIPCTGKQKIRALSLSLPLATCVSLGKLAPLGLRFLRLLDEGLHEMTSQFPSSSKI